MEDNCKTLWDNFKSSFKKNMFETEKKYLLEEFKKPTNRKYFFKYELLQAIAKDLKLEYNEDEEFLRVDYTLFKRGEKKFDVPMIFIESENNYGTIDKEVCKLFSLNAPLKILIVYPDWHSDEIQRQYSDNDFEWTYIFEDFIKEHQIIGFFAVIFINCKEKIIANSILYNNTGKIIEGKEKLFEI